MNTKDMAVWLAAKLACDPDVGPSEPECRSWRYEGYLTTHHSVTVEMNGQRFELTIRSMT